jgi:hypothetical protein
VAPDALAIDWLLVSDSDSAWPTPVAIALDWAPRDIRIKALELMPMLVYRLNEAVANAIRMIQRAKETV